MTRPFKSVIDTLVLLKVASTWAIPWITFLLCLALTTFLTASPSSSADMADPGAAAGAGAAAAAAAGAPASAGAAGAAGVASALEPAAAGAAAERTGFSFASSGLFASLAIAILYAFGAALVSLARTTPTVLRGPLRVRALVEVRWPRTGRPFLWRKPR
jgi:hypothetical protein